MKPTARKQAGKQTDEVKASDSTAKSKLRRLLTGTSQEEKVEAFKNKCSRLTHSVEHFVNSQPELESVKFGSLTSVNKTKLPQTSDFESTKPTKTRKKINRSVSFSKKISFHPSITDFAREYGRRKKQLVPSIVESNPNSSIDHYGQEIRGAESMSELDSEQKAYLLKSNFIFRSKPKYAG